MAGTVVTDNKIHNRLRTIVWEWTADASGDVSGEGLVNVPGGTVHAFAHDPISGVTDNYDAVVLARRTIDSGTTYEFADVLSGAGADLSNSTDGAAPSMVNNFPIGPNTQLELNLSNAGNAATGIFILHIWEDRR